MWRRGKRRFNTQPPEGGWAARQADDFVDGGFNTQPPEGGWIVFNSLLCVFGVSTHSRLKAAGKV